MATQLEWNVSEVDQLKAEVRALRRENQRLNALAYRDPLTGLRNRRYLNERLCAELSRLDRGNSQHLSAIAIDINGFKELNDAGGHAAGDAVLVQVAAVLEARLRDIDLCCRVGGDEFTVLLPDTDPSRAHAVAQRLKDATHVLQSVSLAVGVAHWSPGTTGGQLLAAADAAMYADKRMFHCDRSQASSAA